MTDSPMLPPGPQEYIPAVPGEASFAPLAITASDLLQDVGSTHSDGFSSAGSLHFEFTTSNASERGSSSSAVSFGSPAGEEPAVDLSTAGSTRAVHELSTPRDREASSLNTGLGGGPSSPRSTLGGSDPPPDGDGGPPPPTRTAIAHRLLTLLENHGAEAEIRRLFNLLTSGENIPRGLLVPDGAGNEVLGGGNGGGGEQLLQSVVEDTDPYSGGRNPHVEVGLDDSDVSEGGGALQWSDVSEQGGDEQQKVGGAPVGIFEFDEAVQASGSAESSASGSSAGRRGKNASLIDGGGHQRQHGGGQEQERQSLGVGRGRSSSSAAHHLRSATGGAPALLPLSFAFSPLKVEQPMPIHDGAFTQQECFSQYTSSTANIVQISIEQPSTGQSLVTENAGLSVVGLYKISRAGEKICRRYVVVWEGGAGCRVWGGGWHGIIVVPGR